MAGKSGINQCASKNLRQRQHQVNQKCSPLTTSHTGAVHVFQGHDRTGSGIGRRLRVGREDVEHPQVEAHDVDEGPDFGRGVPLQEHSTGQENGVQLPKQEGQLLPPGANLVFQQGPRLRVEMLPGP